MLHQENKNRDRRRRRSRERSGEYRIRVDEFTLDVGEMCDRVETDFAAVAREARQHLHMAREVTYIVAAVAYKLAELLHDDDDMWARFKQDDFWDDRAYSLKRARCLLYAFMYFYGSYKGGVADRARAHARAVEGLFHDGVSADEIVSRLTDGGGFRGLGDERAPHLQDDAEDSDPSRDDDAELGDAEEDDDGGSDEEEDDRHRDRPGREGISAVTKRLPERTRVDGKQQGGERYVDSTKGLHRLEVLVGETHLRRFNTLAANEHIHVEIVRRANGNSPHPRLQVLSVRRAS